MRQFRVLSILSTSFLVGVLFCFTLVVMGQSGRRTAKTAPPQPSPVGTASEPAAKPAETAAKPAALVSLEVGIDSFDNFSRIPITNYHGVYDSFLARLRRSPSVKIVDSGMNISRGDAVRKAKATKDVKVVWLQLGLDRIGANRDLNPDIRDAFIEFFVYAPTTAKIIAQGRTYTENRIQNPESRIQNSELRIQALLTSEF